MIPFRIGGDEYVLLTGLTDRAQAESIAARILADNGKSILWEGQEIPVGMHSGVAQLDTARHLNYAKLFRSLDSSIRV